MSRADDESVDGRLVLVVDDNATVGSFVVAVLESGGYQATHVTDERAAVPAAREARFDLLLPDVVLDAGIDGVDAEDRVRAATSSRS